MAEHAPEFFALQAAVAGRYSIVREVGRGGMGLVFAARDVALDRPVAIKLLPPELGRTEAYRRRFLREARTAAALAHPHIVPIHAVEEAGDLVFFVMGLVDGESLGDRIRRTGPLPARDAIRIVQEIAWALGYAHSRGVTHRDVKPDNVLIDHEQGRALVTDFGIAHVPGRDTPVEGTVVGTPAYMSPEQARGAEPGASSDIYSLGVTAWMALCGQLPFPGPTAVAFITQHTSAPVPPLRTLTPLLDPHTAAVVERCLAKDPAERWQSADALANALGDALEADRARLPVAPAPIRGFLREWDRVGAGIATTGSAAVVSGILAVGIALMPGSSFTASVMGAIYGMMWALFSVVALERLASAVGSARRLRREGYDHLDVTRAMRSALLADAGDHAAPDASAARNGALKAAAGIALGGVGVLGMWASNATAAVVLFTSASVLAPTMGVRAWLASRQGKSGDGLWNRLASGWLGKLVFRAAALGAGAKPAPKLMAGESTVVALGGAARQAFAALPPTTRDALGDIPALLDRLEREAEVVHAGAMDPAGAARRTTAVAAMEMVRLDLLRISSAAAPSELTELIARARDLSRHADAAADVAALVAAKKQ